MSDTINPTNTLWSERWQLLLDEFNVDVRRWRGQLNVAGCRVEAIDIGVGQISAQVQDRDRGSCRVVVRVTPFRDEQWAQLLDALGERTFFVAQLLAGELPPEIEQIFAEVGVHLVPTNLGETANDCTCALDAPRGQVSGNRPVAALYAALAEMIADDPWLLFRLRGRTQPQILQALRQRRHAATPPTNGNGSSPLGTPGDAADGSGHGARYGWVGLPNDAKEDEVNGPGGDRAGRDSVLAAGDAADSALAAQLDDYWGNPKALDGLQHPVAPPAVELALLRRLGPPLSDHSLQVYDQLAQVYRQVSEKALALAYATSTEFKSD